MAAKLDDKLEVDTFCLVRVKGIRNPVLVAITGFSEEDAFVVFYKPVKRNNLIWKADSAPPQWLSRTKIIASGIPADMQEDNEEEYFLLRKSPLKTLEELGLK